MIDVSDAVGRASQGLKALIPSADHILLEEVEISDDDQYWLITLSFTDPVRQGVIAAAVLTHALSPKDRLYRVVKLNRETGEVRSLKIRETANV